jgi:diacylglycerol O-acyltransferase 2, plant
LGFRVNATSVDKKNLIKIIKDGISPVLCPGGVQEVTLMKDDNSECVLYLNKHRGFVKLALQFGLPIVPVFSFGLQNTFSYWVPKHWLATYIGRKFGVLPMAFFGLWGLPMGPAKPCQYTNVVAPPIITPKIAEPTDEDIGKYHEIYCKELTRLFETYKAKYGMDGVVLRIV